MPSFIGQPAMNVEEITRSLRESALLPLRQMLPDHEILAACKKNGYEKFRCRRLDPVITVQHLLLQAIQREESFAATCAELAAPLAARGASPAAVFSSAATSKARSRLPKAVLQELVQQACSIYAEPVFERWRGMRLLALDCTTVSMPAQAALFKHFGVHKARHTTTKYPLATAAFLLTVGTSLLVQHAFGPHDPGEMRTALPLLEHLGPGDLLLADRHYAGSPFIARVQATGAHFLMRKNARLKTGSLPVLKRLGKDDFITELLVDKNARTKDPALPVVVRVRIFRSAWRAPSGERVTEWFVTSREDARCFPPKTLARLYHRRWQIETSYREFKVAFHADVLRGRTVANIEKEFLAHVLAYQLVRRLIVQAARKHKLIPVQISFLNAARWVTVFSALMRSAPAVQLPRLYQSLLDVLAHALIDVRPGRLEPRAIARERKHYPRLRIPRSKWRERRLAGLPERFA